MQKCVGSIGDDSMIVCDEIIEEAKAIPTNFNEKKVTCKTKKIYILLTFLLITVALLIAISKHYYLIKYRAKQKHLLPYYITN